MTSFTDKRYHVTYCRENEGGRLEDHLNSLDESGLDIIQVLLTNSGWGTFRVISKRRD